MKSTFRTSIELDIPNSNFEALNTLLDNVGCMIDKFAIHHKVEHYNNGTICYDLYVEASKMQTDQLYFYLQSFRPFALSYYGIVFRQGEEKWLTKLIYSEEERRRTKNENFLIKLYDVINSYIHLGFRLRNMAKIKIRQPLSILYIKPKDFFERYALLYVDKKIILQELNIKRIILIGKYGEEYPEVNDFRKVTHKINFKTLGPKYKNLLQKIKAHIEAMNTQKIKALSDAGSYKFNLDEEDIIIEKGDVIFESKYRGHNILIEEQDTFVALDTTITPELRDEGIMRDFIRIIQKIRKSQNLKVNDKVNVAYWSKNFVIMNALHKWRRHIAKEVLAKHFSCINSIGSEEDVRFRNNEMKIRIRK